MVETFHGVWEVVQLFILPQLPFAGLARPDGTQDTVGNGEVNRFCRHSGGAGWWPRGASINRSTRISWLCESGCIQDSQLCRAVTSVSAECGAPTSRIWHRRCGRSAGAKLPAALSVAEVQALLATVEPEYQLMVKLLYGSGLRLMELLRLRVKRTETRKRTDTPQRTGSHRLVLL
jgi:integrase